MSHSASGQAHETFCDELVNGLQLLRFSQGAVVSQLKLSVVEGNEEYIVKQNGTPLGPAESRLILQASLEGLDPQQVLARDLIVKFGLGSEPTATAYVKEIGSAESAKLKEVLQRAQDTEKALLEFQNTNFPDFSEPT